MTLQLELSANFWSYFDMSGKEKKFHLSGGNLIKSSYQTQIGSIIPSILLTDSFKLPFYLSFPALQLVLFPMNLLKEWMPLEPHWLTSLENFLFPCQNLFGFLLV